MSAGPLTRRTGPRQEGPSSVEVTTTDTETVPRQLAWRREAARRLPPLVHCGADPWLADQRRWRDAWDVEMAQLGWAPEWQRERARQLWRDGTR